jgi:hypothetical protein
VPLGPRLRPRRGLSLDHHMQPSLQAEHRMAADLSVEHRIPPGLKVEHRMAVDPKMAGRKPPGPAWESPMRDRRGRYRACRGSGAVA